MLLSWSIQQWQMIDGYLMLHGGGIRLEEESLPRALNILYQLMIQNKDDKEVKKINRKLRLNAKDSWRRAGSEARPITRPDDQVDPEQAAKQAQLMQLLNRFSQV